MKERVCRESWKRVFKSESRALEKGALKRVFRREKRERRRNGGKGVEALPHRRCVRKREVRGGGCHSKVVASFHLRGTGRG